MHIAQRSPASGGSFVRRALTLVASLALMATMAVVTAAPASAANVIAGGIEYDWVPSDSGYHAVGCRDGCPQKLVIPDIVQGYPVMSIAPNAFTSGPADNIAEVVIGKNVKTIGENAFEAENLNKLTLGTAVQTIGDHAFSHASLTSVVIPDSVVSIGLAAFSANKLRSVSLGSGLKVIGGTAFYDNELTRVSVPDSVTTIGPGAFSTNSLTHVTIGRKVDNIQGGAFGYNPSLKSVVMTGPPPSTITPAGAVDKSFETSSGMLVVGVPYQYRSTAYPNGYPVPPALWKGYTTQVLVTVNFSANGHGTTPGRQMIPVGSRILQVPADPTASGWKFTGWYTTSAATTLFDFTTNIAKNVTIFAGWQKIEQPDPGKPKDPDPTPGNPGTPGKPSPGKPGPTPGKPGTPGTPAPADCNPFPDVSSSNLHCRNIEWAKSIGLTRPIGGLYQPDDNVRRGSMTAFMFRLVHPGQPAPKCAARPFKDVPVDHLFCGYIQWAADSGLAYGYSDQTFRPDNFVTRGAMSAFMQRLASGKPSPTCTQQPYTDVRVTDTFCPTITWAKQNDITTGMAGGATYGTELYVNRASMASFLKRLHDHLN